MADADDEAQLMAIRCAGQMWAADVCARGLGLILVEAAPGRAMVEIAIDETMINAHGSGHGGIVFALADSAFALASNSRGERHVAQEASIHFVRPATVGKKLRAEAIERTAVGRNSIVDVTVSDEDGAIIAEFRGRARTTGERVLDDES